MLPARWECSLLTNVSQTASRRCAVQPMMTLSFHVARLGVDESAPPGRQVLDETAGHLLLARHARVTGVTVRVSLDNGRTWRQRASDQPRRRALPRRLHVTLRVSASDAARGRITETIIRAYRVAAARPGK